MEAFVRSPFIVEKASIDTWCYPTLENVSSRRKVRSRPFRVHLSGRLCVLYKNRAYPVAIDSIGELFFAELGESFHLKDCDKVELGTTFQVPCPAWVSTPAKNFGEPGWEICKNQFGVIVYLNESDDFIEDLVTEISSKKKLAIKSWDTTNSKSEFGSRYQWYILLSEAINDRSLSVFISKFFRSKLSVSKKKNETKSTDSSTIKDTEVGQQAKHEKEIDAARREIERLQNKLGEVEAYSNSLINEKKRVAQRFRRNPSERLLAIILREAFSDLAFHPETPKLILDKFVNSKHLWLLLKKLEAGVNIKRKKLNGVAGQAGWYEIIKHISTGTDDRGRVYVRPSSKEHKFDVKIHWKKNSIDQVRVMEQLGRLSPFENSESVIIE